MLSNRVDLSIVDARLLPRFDQTWQFFALGTEQSHYAMSHERLMPNTSPCSQLKACQWHMMVTQPASKPPFSLLSHARVTFYKKIISLISHGTNPPHLAQRGANCQHVSGPAIY